jgi:hypothetical protein
MHPTKFRFIWQSGCRGKDYLEIIQSETRIVYGGHIIILFQTMNDDPDCHQTWSLPLPKLKISEKNQ